MPDLSGAQGSQPVSLFDETSGFQLVIDSSGRIGTNLVASGTALTVTGSSLNVNVTNATLAVTQSGTWNINNISGTISLPTGASTETTLASVKTQTDKLTFAATRLLVDGSGVIQPVSGTVTANIGTTNGLALNTSVTGLQVSQGSTTSGQQGALTLGAVTTAAPSYTTAQTSPLSLTTSGELRVLDTSDGPVSPGTAATKSQLVGGQYNSTAPTLTNTQQASLQVDSSGNLLVNVTSSTTGTTPPTAATISAYTSANKVYVTAFNVNMPTSGTDNPLLLVRNPTGSGKTLYVYKLGFGSTVANVSAVFKVFSDPTVTANGTSQAATSLNIGGGAPAASVLSTSTPTITANGAEIESYEAGSNNNSGSFVEDFSIHVAANHALLITGNPGSNNRDAALTIVWVEV
jgi:hypothetical protein